MFEEDGLQPVSQDCRAAVRQVAAALAEAGHLTVEARPPNPAEVRGAFDIVLATESAAALPAVVGDRIDELSPYLQEMFATARHFQPSWAAYFDASARLARCEAEADAWFAEHPVAVCPAAPEVAPPLGGAWSAEIDGVPTKPGGKLTLATYASALGLPAVCVPVMRAAGRGLPVGVQLIGARGSERTLLSLASALESAGAAGWLSP